MYSRLRLGDSKSSLGLKSEVRKMFSREIFELDFPDYWFLSFSYLSLFFSDLTSFGVFACFPG